MVTQESDANSIERNVFIYKLQAAVLYASSDNDTISAEIKCSTLKLINEFECKVCSNKVLK